MKSRWALPARPILPGAARAQAASGNPLRIGFSQSLSGGLAGNGRAALVAQQIWAEDVNAHGGLLGRPGATGLL